MEYFKGINGVFYLAAILTAAVAFEVLIPWRRGVKIDIARWLRNASLAFYGTIILSLIPPIAGYGGAVAAEARGLGLMNLLAVPMWAQLVFTVVVFDLIFYGQHRILHKYYFLWRLHRAHHSDVHIDASTSLRFHPFEALFRASTEVVFIFALGAPPEGILLVFGVDVFFNTLTHTNIAPPPAVDRLVSRVFVTPHIHRLHHSATPEHQYKNFGTVFTLWDRMFGTYCAPERLRDDETFGLDGPEQPEADSFANLVLDPFRTPAEPEIPHPALEKHSESERIVDPRS